MSDDAIKKAFEEALASREAAGLIPSEKRPMARQRADQKQGQAWHHGLERFTRNNVNEVVAELTEMGIGTFARGILMAMEGPECPLCKRGGEPWAYQTFAKTAKVIGDDTLQALALKSLGVSLELVHDAVRLYKSIDGASPEETDRMAREWLQGRGWQCLEPSAAVSPETSAERSLKFGSGPASALSS